MNEQNAEKFLDLILEKLIAGDAGLKSTLAHQPELTRQIRPHLEAASWLKEHAVCLDPAPRFTQSSWLRVRTRILNEKKKGLPWLNIMGLRLQSFPGGFLLPFVVTLLLLIALTGSGIVFAAQDTLPNDSLYEVKRSFENAQLTLTLSEVGQAKVLATIATKRLHEAHWAAQEDRMDDSQTALLSYITTSDELFLRLNQLSPQEFIQILDHIERALSLQLTLFDALGATIAATSSPNFEQLSQTFQAAQVEFITLQSLVETVRSEIPQESTATPSLLDDDFTPTPVLWQSPTPTESTFNPASSTPWSSPTPDYPFQSATPTGDIYPPYTPHATSTITAIPEGGATSIPSTTPSPTPFYQETFTPGPTQTPDYNSSATPTLTASPWPSKTPSATPSG